MRKTTPNNLTGIAHTVTTIEAAVRKIEKRTGSIKGKVETAVSVAESVEDKVDDLQARMRAMLEEMNNGFRDLRLRFNDVDAHLSTIEGSIELRKVARPK